MVWIRNFINVIVRCIVDFVFNKVILHKQIENSANWNYLEQSSQFISIFLFLESNMKIDQTNWKICDEDLEI